MRKLSSTGKKKSELVALAYSASIMKIPPVKTSEEEQKERAFVYSDFLKTDDGVLPDPLHDLRDGWVGESEGRAMCPPPPQCTTTYPITWTARSLDFVGRSCERDFSRITKEGKAYSDFASGWLKEVRYHPVFRQSSFCFLRAECTPSQRINNTPPPQHVGVSKENGRDSLGILFMLRWVS